MTNKIEISRELAQNWLSYMLASDSPQLKIWASLLGSALAAPAVERQPEAFMYQHDETGQIGFVDIQQVEWGFEKNNPRLKIICPLYRSPPAPVAVIDQVLGSTPEDHMRWLLEKVVNLEKYPKDVLHNQIRATLDRLDKVKEMNK